MPTRLLALVVGVLVLVLTAGCGSSGGSSGSGSGGSGGGVRGTTITLATHDSWAMDKKVMAAFTAQTGIKVRIATQGDAGELTNKLVLTKDHPIADAVFGIDNTFASRAVEEGVLARYTPARVPAGLQRFELPGTDASYLTPVDYGDVCVNVDDTWFARKHLAPPRTLADLVDRRYRGLFVTPGATTSSPGLAFLLTTIAAYGDGWKDYWRRLAANDVKIDAGWTDAYEVDFTAGGGNGTRPIVLSYSSSPPFTVPKGGTEPTTSALLDTCFRQVEYAGVLHGAEHPEAARMLVDYLLGAAFQKALPDNMYVYPVDTTQPLPAGWSSWAPTARKPYVVAPADIATHRTDWLREWRDIATG